MFYRSGTDRRFVFSHQVPALFCYLKSVTSDQKYDSVNWHTFTWGTFLPKFIPIWFERLFGRGRPNKKKKNMS